jgi:UDP-glucose 4-epimerase
MKNILVTGGAGYIGSHVVAELAAAGFRPIILDNFSTSDKAILAKLERLTGSAPICYEADYQDADTLAEILRKEDVHSVIHIAAFKAVAESVEKPLKYYRNNVAGFVSLLETVMRHKVHNFVFSSSAAVYGNPPLELVTEETPCAPESPYGCKRMDEIVLRDTCAAEPRLTGVALRYFNVVGSHASGIIGESPLGKPQNLLPIIVQAAAGNIPPLTVYGTDYPTPDGTCLRDYIHVVDLAKAHVAALQKIAKERTGCHVYNIGTSKPVSVMELIQTFEKVNGVAVPHTLGSRRAGDPVAYYADGHKAEKELGWHPENTIQDAVRSAWQWQQNQVSAT